MEMHIVNTQKKILVTNSKKSIFGRCVFAVKSGNNAILQAKKKQNAGFALQELQKQFLVA